MGSRSRRGGTQIFKPYFAIGATESTRLYQPVPV
jgi:hypothetical protein